MKILIVDDEPELREILEGALSMEGMTVRTAKSGRDALSVLKSETFDVVVSDIRMPDGDGIELLKSMRSSGNLTPVIFMTGFASVNEAEALALGAFKLIKKPFELEKLTELLTEAANPQKSNH